MPNQDYGRGGTLDKYEYKIRAEEIKTLISQKKYVDAAKVADTIDWTRVKSVMMPSCCWKWRMSAIRQGE